MTNKDNQDGSQQTHRGAAPHAASDERRVFNRVKFSSPAKIIQRQKIIPVEIIDISLKGVLIKEAIHQNTSDISVDMKSPLQLIISLSENTLIDMSVEAVHKISTYEEAAKEADETIIGCRCISIDHISLTHLRRLIMLNSSSPIAADRELAALYDDQCLNP